MKFNIVTFHRAYNYGAVLQAYALQEFIKKMGYSSGVYDYCSPGENKYKGIKGKILQSFLLLDKKNILSRKEKYNEFVEEMMNLNTEINSDIYIAGSDQVWNPCGIMDPIYFLRFVSEDSIKASYAASLGDAVIPKEKKDLLKVYVNDFNFISVREEFSRNLLLELCIEKDISVNIDPTLLHDANFWENIAEKVNLMEEKYILVYLMHKPKNINLLLKWLKKETNYKIIIVDGQGIVQGIMTHLIINDTALHAVGPKEFIWLIANAQMVVTSSFHGTAFSLLFHKEVYSIGNNPESRVGHLLNMCGLDMVFENTENFNRNNRINWNNVDLVLKRERERSFKYLEHVAKMIDKK